MSIVLDEYTWAEQAIQNRSLGTSPLETLSRVSKYYASQKYPKKEVRHMLDIFLAQCDPRASLLQWSETLDRIAKNSDKYPLVRIEKIDITIAEITKIKSLKGKQLRRLAFTLLCLSKYWDTVSEKNNHWVNTSDKEIMKMANINTSIVRQSEMFAELRDSGLIRFSKKIDNLNVQVLFIDENGFPPALSVRDFRNLGYQYMMYCGEHYFACENCGLVTKINEPKKGRKQKYCKSCASEKYLQQRLEWMSRYRESIKS